MVTYTERGTTVLHLQYRELTVVINNQVWNRYIQIVNVISSLVYRNGNEWFTFYVTLTRTDHTSASITISDGMDTALLNPSAEPFYNALFFVTFYRKKTRLPLMSSFRFYKKKMFWCPPQPTHSSLLIIVFIWHFIQFQLIYVLQWAPPPNRSMCYQLIQSFTTN